MGWGAGHKSEEGRMACDGSFNQNSIQIWSRVRDGSVLELAVEAADGVVSGARVLIDHPSGRTEERLWEDGDLNPGIDIIEIIIK